MCRITKMTREIISSELSLRRHNALHHPEINGKKNSAEPFLTLPFNKQDLVDSINKSKDPRFTATRPYEITEGSFYSLQEKRIHGYDVHAAIDYQVPYGTHVAAPCNGFAIASYHTFDVKNDDGSQRMYKGKPVGFGLGYFVQIYDPNVDRYVQLGHLSDLSKNVQFSKPVSTDAGWNPTNHILSIRELMDGSNPLVVVLKKGDYLGNVGYSGLRWGYTEYELGRDRPLVIDPDIYKSHDEPHVHLEEYYRDQATGRKGWQRDPYDIYLRDHTHYPTPTRNRPMGSEPLFHLDQSELPKFADS